MYRDRKSGVIGIIITIIILILIVIFSNGENNSTFFENIASNLVMPMQNGLTYLKNKISGNGTFFTDIKNLKQENENLRNKNSQLEQSLRELENIKTQNQTLKEYLNLTEKYGEYKTIPGYVINKDISNYSKTIVINIGKKDGVEEKMTVIADEGLVGYVISVTDNTAKVRTIVEVFSPKDNPSKIIYCPEKKNSGGFALDITNAKEELGYEPKYGIKELLEDYKEEMKVDRFLELRGR